MTLFTESVIGSPQRLPHCGGIQSRRTAPHKKAQLCRVFLYSDPAALGGVIRVSKCGFYGTAFRI